MIITVKEFLQKSSKDITVPELTEIDIDPKDGEFSDLFHQVRIQSFQDLQDLDIIPAQLDEKNIRQALAEDDERCLQMAQKLFENQANTPTCNGRSTRNIIKYNYRFGLRSIYDRIRKRQNFSLSDLLSKHYGRKVEWDSLVPLHLRLCIVGLNNISKMAMPVNIVKTHDIDVGSKGGLNLGDSQKMLVAKDIRIHKGGKIKIKTPYIYIKCQSIQGDIP